ncbi:MAG: hypothetical protein H7Y42_14430 [Chitinophagaceae bacterium]|nr:hypothetical protein [Chitinophagaceae bacterium]
MFDEIEKAPPQYKMIDGKIEFDRDDPVTFFAKIGAAIGIQQQAPKCHLVQQVGGLFAADATAEIMNTGIAIIDQIKPKGALESLLAVQMIGCHNAAVEMMKRALLSEQTTDGVDANINRATKLMRTFTAQTEALSRLRGKGQQAVRVEHVTVHAGSQAIVGNVEHKTGGEG